MDSEALALIIRAKDEASGEFKKVEATLHNLNEKTKLTEGAMGALHDVMKGIGMGIGLSVFTDLESSFSRLVGLIPSLIEKGLTFAGTVEQIQRATGASAETASRFAGQMEFLGHSTEGLSLRLGIMSKGIIAHASDLTHLGVSLKDANGHWLDQVTIVNRAREALAGMQDGIAKTTLATKLFGRAGADMLDWLNLNNNQIKILNGEMDALGVTMTQAMVDNARDATREGNLLNLAMQGLGNTLTANVAPALTTAVDSLVNFVQQNGQAIAAFASQVVNFVLGMIAALTGATVQTVSFTGEINAAATASGGFSSALENTTGKQRAAAGGARAHTAALDGQIAKTTKAIDAIKALDTAQDASFIKQMGHLSALLGAQLSALDASEKAHALAETQAAQAQQMSDAQRSLADALAGSTDSQGVTTVDPRAVEAAQRSITAITQQQADLQTSIVNDARRAQIKDVQGYVDAMTKAETTWTDKKALLGQLQKDQGSLASASEAAAKVGDIQKVADLAIEMEAVHTAIARTEQAKRNGDRTTDLTKHKAQLEDIKKAAAAAATGPGGIGPVFIKGATDAGVAIKKMAGDTNSEMYGIREAIAGDKLSVAGAMETARLAGMKFGTDMKVMIGQVVDAVQVLIDKIAQLGHAVTDQGLSMAGGAAVGAKVGGPAGALVGGALGGIAAAKPGTAMFDPGGPLQGILEAYDGIFGTHYSTIGTRADGGPVTAGMPYIVGERRAEVFVPDTNGTIQPRTGGGMGGTSVTFAQGSVVVNGVQDPAQIAREVLLHLKRELTRQNTSLSGGY